MTLTPRFAVLCHGLLLAAACSTLPWWTAQAQEAPAAAATPQDELASLRARTSLVGKAINPWHMVVNFSVQGLDGKPADTGTLEEWWAAPGQQRIVIESRLLHEITPAEGDPAQPLTEEGRRELYLVNLLLQQIVNPVAPETGGGAERVKSEKTTRQKLPLTCLDVSAEAEPGAVRPAPVSRVTYCMELASGRLRLLTDSTTGSEVVFNRTATFQRIQLGMNTTIALGFPAISGSIQKLSGWDPEQQPEKLSQGAGSPALANAVAAGRKTGGAVPSYPESARRDHASGRVTLGALISTQGAIKHLTVLASPRSDLADAAKKAVATWTYVPYKLDGKPTEVDTTITVNFNIAIR